MEFLLFILMTVVIMYISGLQSRRHFPPFSPALQHTLFYNKTKKKYHNLQYRLAVFALFYCNFSPRSYYN